MNNFSEIPSRFPKGSTVHVISTGEPYTVVGYLTKGGIVAGSMITVADAEGTRFFYGASKLETEEEYYGRLAELQEISEQR